MIYYNTTRRPFYELGMIVHRKHLAYLYARIGVRLPPRRTHYIHAGDYVTTNTPRRGAPYWFAYRVFHRRRRAIPAGHYAWLRIPAYDLNAKYARAEAECARVGKVIRPR